VKRRFVKFFNMLKPDNKVHLLVVLFFIFFLVLGTFIFSDYGLSWDEGLQRNIGLMNIDYVLNNSNALLDSQDRYHGAFFEIILISIEKIFHLEDTKSIYLGRHLANFLTFYLGVIFFYLLCKHYFRNWKIAILGCLLLILSPRIFSDSFYNCKDIPFMSIFIISIYLFVKYTENKNWLWVLLHSLTSAILIDIRIMGVLLPFFTLLFTITNSYHTHKVKKNALNLVVYFSLLAIFMIVLWPVLWKNPLHHFLQAFIQMSHYPWNGAVLYFGKYVSARSLPGHYIPVWIIITTPILYILAFFAGLFSSLNAIFRNPSNYLSLKKKDLIFLLWFFLPLITIIVFKSVLYDGWRHMFFIYPAFLVIALNGLVTIWNALQKKRHTISLAIFVLIVTLSLASTAYGMVTNHPHQNVYFNFLVEKNARNNFELDYWGLSYRQALEHILEKEPKGVINFTATNWPGQFNLEILDPIERSRLRHTSEAEAEYLLTNFRGHKEDYPYNEVYNITAYGSKILSVYKLR